MLRRMQKEPNLSLSITRQVIQSIWLQIENHSDGKLSGLLGTTSDSNEIDVAIHAPLTKPEALASTAEAWRQQKITLIGIFQSEAPQISRMKSLQQQLHASFPSNSGQPMIHLHLNIDTQGCLKSYAYCLQNDLITDVPIELIEDRQSPLKS